MVDGWIAFDDRGSSNAFGNEPERRRALLTRAREIDSDWVLFMDSDERIEQGAAQRLKSLTQRTDPVVWGFCIRELYAADAYGIDGVWGRKERPSMFRLCEGQTFSSAPVHGPCFPIKPVHKRLSSGLNIYHLKMIAPRRRQARRDFYQYPDPNNAYQSIGYDYLADETEIILEMIPEGRGFFPPHKDDNTLWMAEVPKQETGS